MNNKQHEIIDKRVKLRKQYDEIYKKIMGIKITCGGCYKRVNFFWTYRCFYCGIFYCKSCSEKHFK